MSEALTGSGGGVFRVVDLYEVAAEAICAALGGEHLSDEAPELIEQINDSARAAVDAVLEVLDRDPDGVAGLKEEKGPMRRWTMVRRGLRVTTTDQYIWWQELPEGEDADSLRSVGYEVVEMVEAPAERSEALGAGLCEEKD